MKVVGVILAGGRSRRFGREKAAAEVNGRPMIAWVLDVLRAGCDEVAVNAGPTAQAFALGRDAGCPILGDDPADPAGPLAGVRAGLVWAGALGADAMVSAPCDTPFLPANLVARLVEGWGLGDGARIAVSATGPEPLTALWPVSRALRAVDVAVSDGRHPPVREVLGRLGATGVGFADPGAFANLNTPEDHLAAVQTGRPLADGSR